MRHIIDEVNEVNTLSTRGSDQRLSLYQLTGQVVLACAVPPELEMRSKRYRSPYLAGLWLCRIHQKSGFPATQLVVDHLAASRSLLRLQVTPAINLLQYSSQRDKMNQTMVFLQKSFMNTSAPLVSDLSSNVSPWDDVSWILTASFLIFSMQTGTASPSYVNE
jgi:hypothetical protein